jgi:spermidine/putrescine transport system ATP-binding protein
MTAANVSDQDTAVLGVSPGPAGIRLVAIERRYKDVAAVAGVDLSITAGEFFSLIGPSGCGKTTTLRLVAGLEAPTSGRVFVGETDVTRLPAYRRPVNTVFQDYALFPHLNVFENVAFGLRERRVARREAEGRVREMLELVGLAGREHMRCRQLSGGQQQRVALARSLVLKPQVLLLDEPLGALDLKLRKQMQMALKQIHQEVGITFIYVTHDQEEAFSMSDRVAIMNAGRIQQVGEPEDVYHHPSSLFVADFVGASNQLTATVRRCRGEGRYLADIGPLGTLELSGTPGMTEDSAAVAVVRPEAIGPPTSSCDITVAVRVADVSFLGAQTQYTVESEDLGTLLMFSNTPIGFDGPRGAHREVGWRSEDMWLVAADGP